MYVDNMCSYTTHNSHTIKNICITVLHYNTHTHRHTNAYRAEVGENSQNMFEIQTASTAGVYTSTLAIHDVAN